MLNYAVVTSRYRHHPPPYELMNPGTLTSPGPVYRSQTDTDSITPPSVGRSGRWWARTAQPLVLRLPVGLAVVLGLTFLLLIVLAYWAGQAHGRRGASVRSIPLEPGHVQAPPSKLAAGQPAMSLVDHQEGSGGRHGSAAADRQEGVTERRAGLNYFVLAHYPEADARRLVTFLRRHGVEATAVRPHNKRLFQVIALRGFRRDQIESPGRRQFERELRQLGRAWKSQRLGPDFSQTGIYLDLYEENEPVAETLFTEDSS